MQSTQTECNHSTDGKDYARPGYRQGYAMNQNSPLLVSGIGQKHTNEPDPQKPEKRLTPYITIVFGTISHLVKYPQAVDKTKAQWVIASTLLSRIFKEQEQHGEYWMLWADLDKHPPSLPDLFTIVESILGGADFELYNSRSATVENQKARILIYLDIPLGFDEWNLAQEILNDKFAALDIEPDRANERAAQLCYLPNKGAFYGSLSKREGVYFNPVKVFSQEIAAKREIIESKRAALETAKQAAMVRRQALSLSVHPSIFEAFNATYTPQDWLIKAGYDQRGDSFRHPDSETGNYSATVRLDDNGVLRVNTLSTADPLNTNGAGAHDAFSTFCTLFHGGDTRAAKKDAGDNLLAIGGLSYNKAVQIEHQRNNSAPRIETAATPSQQAQQQAYPEPSIDHESGKCIMTSTVEPFPGLMTEIVNSALEDAHKPQKELTILSVLLGMSSACAGEYILPGGGRLNLYGTGIAGTGCGKEHPRNVAELIAGAGCCQVIGQPGSGAGLEDLLESGKSLLLGIDEIAHLMEAINGSKKPTYLIDLAGNLLRLFTASKGIYRTRALAQGKGCPSSAKSIYNPCVNLLGFATPEKLGKAVGVGNIEDGLLGRVLFAMGSDGIKPRRVRNQFLLPCSVIERVKEIGRFTQDVRISMTADANSLLDGLLIDFDTNAIQATTLFERALKMRSFEKCERIAGVLAVWADPKKPLVTVEHVKWAANFVRYSDSTVIKFCADFMHGGEVQTNAALINKTMKRVLDGELIPSKVKEAAHIKARRLPWGFVLKASRLAKKDFDDAVDYLVDLGEIEVMTVTTIEMNGREYKTRILIWV